LFSKGDQLRVKLAKLKFSIIGVGPSFYFSGGLVIGGRDYLGTSHVRIADMHQFRKEGGTHACNHACTDYMTTSVSFLMYKWFLVEVWYSKKHLGLKKKHEKSRLPIILFRAVLSQFGPNSSDQTSADCNHGVPWIAGGEVPCEFFQTRYGTPMVSLGKLSTNGGLSVHLGLG
jgi:hypothetical protein